MDAIGGVIRVASEYKPALGARLAWMREWRRGDPALRVVRGLVRKGDTVVDIGANWGFFAANFARLVGGAGRVHAIEPDPRQRGSLEAISARHGNVTLHATGLSDRDGEGILHVPIIDGHELGALASLSVPTGRTEIDHERVPVRLTRLDALPIRGPVAFVKCDVEGHELAVLRGGGGLLRRDRPAILVEIEQRHQKEDIRHTFEHLAGLGYAGYALRAEGPVPLEEFDVRRDQLDLLGPAFISGAMPAGYVHDFVFVPAGSEARISVLRSIVLG
jgi:FkbM family methyltransferase